MKCSRSHTRTKLLKAIVAGVLAMAASATQAADYRWLNSWDRNNLAITILIESEQILFAAGGQQPACSVTELG